MARRKVGDGDVRRLQGRPVVAGYGADPVGRCPRCWIQPRLCVCPALTVVDAPLPIVVVRHYKESLKSSNSARLLPHVLPGARVVDVSRPRPPTEAPGDDEVRDTRLETVELPDGAVLLYPPRDPDPPDDGDTGPASGEVAATAAPAIWAGPPRALVVPDGTWAQTRRLVRRVLPLPTLPRLAVAAPAHYAPPERLLTPHESWAVSTLEAIGFALFGLGYPEAGQAALDAYAAFVRAARAQAGASVPAGA